MINKAKSLGKKDYDKITFSIESQNQSNLDMSFGNKNNQAPNSPPIITNSQKKNLKNSFNTIGSQSERFPTNVVNQKIKKLKSLEKASEQIYKKLDEIRVNRQRHLAEINIKKPYNDNFERRLNHFKSHGKLQLGEMLSKQKYTFKNTQNFKPNSRASKPLKYTVQQVKRQQKNSLRSDLSDFQDMDYLISPQPQSSIETAELSLDLESSDALLKLKSKDKKYSLNIDEQSNPFSIFQENKRLHKDSFATKNSQDQQQMSSSICSSEHVDFSKVKSKKSLELSESLPLAEIGGTGDELTYSYASKTGDRKFNSRINHNNHFILPNVFYQRENQNDEFQRNQQKQEQKKYIYVWCV